jgi:hypothetical protein
LPLTVRTNSCFSMLARWTATTAHSIDSHIVLLCLRRLHCACCSSLLVFLKASFVHGQYPSLCANSCLTHAKSTTAPQVDACSCGASGIHAGVNREACMARGGDAKEVLIKHV